MDLDEQELTATRKLNGATSEIKIGEYIRLTRNQGINKIIEIEDNKYILDYEIADEYGDSTYYLEKDELRDEVIKHSKNIIDLIETDDIVILEYYVAKYKRRITRRFEVFRHSNLISFNNVHCDFLYNLDKNTFVDGKGYNVKIKSILTKEQFEQMEYRLEE